MNHRSALPARELRALSASRNLRLVLVGFSLLRIAAFASDETNVPPALPAASQLRIPDLDDLTVKGVRVTPALSNPTDAGGQGTVSLDAPGSTFSASVPLSAGGTASNILPEFLRRACSADWQSAASPTGSRQTIGFTERARIDGGVRIANLRHPGIRNRLREPCCRRQRHPDQTAAALAQKALANSGAMEIVTDLTTGIGPHLAGSDAEKRAAG